MSQFYKKMCNVRILNSLNIFVVANFWRPLFDFYNIGIGGEQGSKCKSMFN